MLFGKHEFVIDFHEKDERAVVAALKDLGLKFQAPLRSSSAFPEFPSRREGSVVMKPSRVKEVDNKFEKTDFAFGVDLHW